MKTIKVIDLLNKIANGEVPEKIKVNEKFIYEYDGIDYKSENGKYLFDSYIEITKEDMNMEVEIIEDTPKENKKILEELQTYKDSNNEIYLDNYCYKYMPIHKDSLSFNEQVIVDKINEIIKLVKDLKE